MGFNTNSPTPNIEANAIGAPKQYAVITVVKVPKNLYDIVFNKCLLNAESFGGVVI
jgi:hypothetical protein